MRRIGRDDDRGMVQESWHFVIDIATEVDQRHGLTLLTASPAGRAHPAARTRCGSAHPSLETILRSPRKKDRSASHCDAAWTDLMDRRASGSTSIRSASCEFHCGVELLCWGDFAPHHGRER